MPYNANYRFQELMTSQAPLAFKSKPLSYAKINLNGYKK